MFKSRATTMAFQEIAARCDRGRVTIRGFSIGNVGTIYGYKMVRLGVLELEFLIQSSI